MKAVVYHKYGTAEELTYTEVDRPIPKDNEVYVKVHASSINSWDWDLLQGKQFMVKLTGGFRKPKRTILGADVAGVVVAVGKNVTRFNIGDEVFGDMSGYEWGGFAEYVCTKEDTLAHKLPSMSFEEAASLPQAGVLALQGLRDKKKIQPGDAVLINGAGGGVGTLGLQYAKSLGATVTCVDKGSKLKMLQELGADYVIDHTQEDYTRNGKQYDLILDNVAHRSIYDYRRALTPTGTFVYVGGNMGRLLLQFLFVAPFLNMLGKKKLTILAHKPNPKDLEELNKLYALGKVVPVIDKLFPLNKTREAFEYFGLGNYKGKVVITV